MSTHFTLKRFYPLVIAGALLAGCVLPGTSRTGVKTPAASEPGSTAQQPPPVVNDENPEPTATENTAQSSEVFTPLIMTVADCSYGGEFRSMEALDKRTVRFELCYPDVAFLPKIAFPSFGIIPTEYLEQTGGGGRESQLLTKSIGSGPYVVEDWKPGEELSFSAFSDYWGKPASIERLVFHWNLDDSQRLLELQTGTVQGIDEPNPQDLTAVQEDPNLVLVSRPPLSVSFLGMNNTYPPLDNQLVRQAISLALDRKMILDENYPSGFQLAEFFTPCVIPNGCVGEPWYVYDPVKAREMLAEAGYPDGFETQISYRSVVRGYLPEPAHVAEAIRAQLKQNLNISAKLSAIDSPKFLQAAEDGLLPGLFLMGWGADYPDASNFLDTHFGSLATKMLGNPFDDILLPLSQGTAPRRKLKPENLSMKLPIMQFASTCH